MVYIPPHKKNKMRNPPVPETRRKSIVIPFVDTRYNNRQSRHYVVVQDDVSGDITFVGGGCKKKETDTTCALRELNEETRNVFGAVPDNALVPVFTFKTKKRSHSELEMDEKEGVVVTTVYTVYFFPLSITKTKFEETMKKKYNASNSINKETSAIMLKSLPELLHLWDNTILFRTTRDKRLKKLWDNHMIETVLSALKHKC